jgi:hypothetical protein
MTLSVDTFRKVVLSINLKNRTQRMSDMKNNDTQYIGIGHSDTQQSDIH